LPSPEVRRRDKDKLTPNRIAKIFLDGFPSDANRGVEVRKYRGRRYVLLSDFKSTRWIFYEKEKGTRDILAFNLVKFCQYKKMLPDDLIEVYKASRGCLR